MWITPFSISCPRCPGQMDSLWYPLELVVFPAIITYSFLSCYSIVLMINCVLYIVCHQISDGQVLDDGCYCLLYWGRMKSLTRHLKINSTEKPFKSSSSCLFPGSMFQDLCLKLNSTKPSISFEPPYTLQQCHTVPQKLLHPCCMPSSSFVLSLLCFGAIIK